MVKAALFLVRQIFLTGFLLVDILPECANDLKLQVWVAIKTNHSEYLLLKSRIFGKILKDFSGARNISDVLNPLKSLPLFHKLLPISQHINFP